MKPRLEWRRWGPEWPIYFEAKTRSGQYAVLQIVHCPAGHYHNVKLEAADPGPQRTIFHKLSESEVIQKAQLWAEGFLISDLEKIVREAQNDLG